MKAEPHPTKSAGVHSGVHSGAHSEVRRSAALEAGAPSYLLSAVEAATDRKALDLRVLDVSGLCDFTDYFLICSATSDRHVQAVAKAVEEGARSGGARPIHREGLQEANWVLLDFGDFVVHVFDCERRDFYRLDRLWGDAPELFLEHGQGQSASVALAADGAGSPPATAAD